MDGYYNATSAVFNPHPSPVERARSYDRRVWRSSICCSVCCPERRTVPSRSMARRVLLRLLPCLLCLVLSSPAVRRLSFARCVAAAAQVEPRPLYRRPT